jgi:hypothetical protein
MIYNETFIEIYICKLEDFLMFIINHLNFETKSHFNMKSADWKPKNTVSCADISGLSVIEVD